MTKMKKGFIFLNLFLVLGTLLAILLIFNKTFFSIPWIETIHRFIYPGLSLVFYEYNEEVYGGIAIALVFFLLLYG